MPQLKSIRQMRVLVCRPEEDAKKLISLLDTPAIKAFVLPTIEIKNIITAIDLSKFSDFIFTSKYAVRSFFAQNGILALKNKELYSVGPATAKELKKLGLYSRYPDKHNAKELFKFIKNHSSFTNKNFAIVSGVGGSNYLENEISKLTIATKVVVYERIFIEQKLLQDAYIANYSDTPPDLIVTTSIDVFRALVRIFENITLPTQAKITITSSKMLKFVLENGFERVLKLEQFDNEYISKQILMSL